jgi:hypothetical protein
MTEYPRIARAFVDSDGHPIQHTFFYPEEQYRQEHLDRLSDLCRQGIGEVEIHLHHDRDTSDNLRSTLTKFRDTLANKHCLLGRDEHGYPRYGFIHGNWALDNSRRDGRFCGVNDELTILRETGCYADFTLPSAPSETQTRTINSIYYAVDDPCRSRSHESGEPTRVGVGQRRDTLLIVQGPITLNWTRRTLGVLPGLDTGAVDGTLGYRPDIRRFRRWVNIGIGVVGLPEWVFVKLHTHGAIERNADTLLGDEMRRFHREIQEEFNDGCRFALHYVSAREMANLVRAAEEGAEGNPNPYRNRWIKPPPALQH